MSEKLSEKPKTGGCFCPTKTANLLHCLKSIQPTSPQCTTPHRQRKPTHQYPPILVGWLLPTTMPVDRCHRCGAATLVQSSLVLPCPTDNETIETLSPHEHYTFALHIRKHRRRQCTSLPPPFARAAAPIAHTTLELLPVLQQEGTGVWDASGSCIAQSTTHVQQPCSLQLLGVSSSSMCGMAVASD